LKSIIYWLKIKQEKIMTACKIITLVIIISALNNSNSAGSNYLHFKYSETVNNFLDTNVKIGNAIEYAGTIIVGDVVKAEKKFKKNIQIWILNIHLPSGGFVEIEISASEKNILQIKAIVSFNSAKKNAEDHSGLKILKWVLKQNKEKYEYNFWVFTKSGKAQVKIDAGTGDLILNSKRKK